MMAQLLPPWPEVLMVIVSGVLLVLCGELIGRKKKKVGQLILILGALGLLAFLFSRYTFGQAILLASLGANAFFSVWLWFDGQEKYAELKERVSQGKVEPIPLKRQGKRLVADFFLTFLVTLGMILALLFLPEETVALPLISLFILINIYGQSLERLLTFFSTQLYLDEEKGELLVLSWTKPKQLPLGEMESIHLESAPDLLKLNPLFVVFTTHQDYTTNMGKVLCLTYPGERIYLTPFDPEGWLKRLAVHLGEIETGKMDERQTFPLWHPRVLKRLAGKLYYAVTIKGISAYSALVLLLYQLDLSPWAIVLCVFIWWGINLYFSDWVLAQAMDCEPLKEGAVYEAAQNIFKRANLDGVRLYVTEADEYNGLAMGMNIGRAMVVLTSATLQLPLAAIEGILAHEAVHVKKRDVLLGQFLRLLGLGVAIALVLANFESIQLLGNEHPWLLIALFALFPWLFPIYLSMAHQWLEVRADHVGSTFLAGGKAQMAEALRQLTIHQERAFEKLRRYNLTEEERKKREEKITSDLERDTWGWRLFEFQFQLHPPMYWRIHMLETEANPWGWSLFIRWLKDRFRESLPDRLTRRT